jgi:uncharacterized protein
MSVGPVVRNEATAEFFDGASAGQFLLRQCPAGHVSEPAAAQCTTCAATDLHSVRAAGGAMVVSWVVSWSRPAAGEPRPTVLVIGELDEGPWWWTQLAGEPEPAADTLAVGRRLRIEFQQADAEHEAVPVFVLA